jgi:hypothetical protein
MIHWPRSASKALGYAAYRLPHSRVLPRLDILGQQSILTQSD